jgi:hypothetical protein
MQSYYNATLALIRDRMETSDMSPAFVAVALRINRDELAAKLSGASPLRPDEIATLAQLFGCPMSAIVA